MADKAFELKGSLFTLTILQLHTFDVDVFQTTLIETIQKAPNFFLNAPIIFDLHRLQSVRCPIDFKGLIERCRKQTLLPIGIIGGSTEQQAQAKSAGLGVLPGQYKSNEEKQSETVVTTAPAIEANAEPEIKISAKTKIIRQPVRSGQQIYAKNADLIVLSSVSHGAELVADGNIHVYGALRGRALAGVNGDTDARIFCRKLDAELISIAGLYQLNDGFADKYKDDFLQIYLEDEKMHIKTV